MNYLGVDYGSKDVGLAIAYQEKDRFVIVGYKTLENKGHKILVEKIQEIILEEDIGKIVVGLPLSLKGTKTQQTKETEIFIQLLKKSLALPVEEEDERLTSALAKQLKGRNIHEESAKIILEGYLGRGKLSRGE